MATLSQLLSTISAFRALNTTNAISPETLGSILNDLLVRTAANIQSRQVDTDLYLDLIDSGGTVLGSLKLPVCTSSTTGVVPGPLYSHLQAGATDGKNAMAQKGKPSGFATLDTGGKLPVAQLPALTSGMLPLEMQAHVCAFDGFKELTPAQDFAQSGLTNMSGAKIYFSKSKGGFYCVTNEVSLTSRVVYSTWAGSSLMDASAAMGTAHATKGVVPIVGKFYYCRTDKAYYLWNGTSMQPELAATVEAQHKVFDDMWLAAVGTYGSIDYTHVEEGVSRPYYLNTLWLTYEEAVKVMDAKPPRTQYMENYLDVNTSPAPRTNLPIVDVPTGGGGANSHHVEITQAFMCNTLEVVNLGKLKRFTGYGGYCRAFQGTNIHTIIGTLDFFGTNVSVNGGGYNTTMFGPALVKVNIFNLNRDLKIVSPVISLESLQYMIQNSSAPAKGITLTVHPTVYAKIADTANTEWNALLDLAASKNVNIATTA